MAESRDERPSFDEASALPHFPDDGSPFGQFFANPVLSFCLAVAASSDLQQTSQPKPTLGDSSQTC
jgi:hypothetical protein